MLGQLPEWFWPWLGFDPELLGVELVVVLELEEDDEPPFAALARAAPPPAITPRTTTVARALRTVLTAFTSFARSLTRRVNRALLKAVWHSPKKAVSSGTR